MNQHVPSHAPAGPKRKPPHVALPLQNRGDGVLCQPGTTNCQASGNVFEHPGLRCKWQQGHPSNRCSTSHIGGQHLRFSPQHASQHLRVTGLPYTWDCKGGGRATQPDLQPRSGKSLLFTCEALAASQQPRVNTVSWMSFGKRWPPGATGAQMLRRVWLLRAPAQAAASCMLSERGRTCSARAEVGGSSPLLHVVTQPRLPDIRRPWPSAMTCPACSTCWSIISDGQCRSPSPAYQTGNHYPCGCPGCNRGTAASVPSCTRD